MKLNTRTATKNLKNYFFRSFYLLIALTLLCSHDLYVKMETYFLQPNQESALSLYNGTFEKSENIITRDRMLDVSVMAQGERVPINPSQWQDKDSSITQLNFKTGKAGTYVVGVSTKARNIELSADKFNSYLENEGVLDVLEYRTKNNLLDQNAVESYEKHVKAIYQVGDVKTNDWNTKLGYPIEFVPQANPYEKYRGDKLKVQLLLDGKPLPNQLVYADYIKSAHAHKQSDHDHTPEHDGEAHTHTSGQQLRTNDQGIVAVNLPEEGIYYLRTIHMGNVTDSDELTHRSKWTTLTFEVSRNYNIPTWIFLVSSLLIIGLVFLVFRKQNSGGQ